MQLSVFQAVIFMVNDPTLTGAAPATGSTKGALRIVWKVAAGALIPAFATIIFNVLNFFFENYQTRPLPQMPHSVSDVGVGCAFSLVGICVTAKEHSLTNSFLIIFVGLLLMILAGQLVSLIWGWDKLYIVWVTNIIALLTLSWAIVEAE